MHAGYKTQMYGYHDSFLFTIIPGLPTLALGRCLARLWRFRFSSYIIFFAPSEKTPLAQKTILCKVPRVLPLSFRHFCCFLWFVFLAVLLLLKSIGHNTRTHPHPLPSPPPPLAVQGRETCGDLQEGGGGVPFPPGAHGLGEQGFSQVPATWH